MHPQKFEIPVNGASIRGELHVPTNASPDHPVPAVLICRGVATLDDTAEELMGLVATSLAKGGVAAARFEHRCSSLILDDFDSHTAQHDIEDACAVFDWLASKEAIDAQSIGVVGYCMGGIAASALAGRYRQTVRLCLIAAPTAAYVRASILKENGAYGAIHAANLPQQYVPSLDQIESAQDAASFEGRALLIHAAADRIVSPQVSLDFTQALREAKRRFECIQVARADHAFSVATAREACLEHVMRFFAAMIPSEPLAAAGRKSA